MNATSSSATGSSRASGGLQNRREYLASFTKANGQVRTMRFATSEANLRRTGLITVYDVENRGLRKFNLSTLIGRIAAVPTSTAVSFCA